MYAVIRSGGKQYRVAPGDTVKVETLPGKVGGADHLWRRGRRVHGRKETFDRYAMPPRRKSPARLFRRDVTRNSRSSNSAASSSTRLSAATGRTIPPLRSAASSSKSSKGNSDGT